MHAQVVNIMSQLPDRCELLHSVQFDIMTGEQKRALVCSLLDWEAQEHQRRVQKRKSRGQNDGFWQELSSQLLLRSMYACLEGYQWLWGNPSLLQWTVKASDLEQPRLGMFSDLRSPSCITVDGLNIWLKINRGKIACSTLSQRIDGTGKIEAHSTLGAKLEFNSSQSLITLVRLITMLQQHGSFAGLCKRIRKMNVCVHGHACICVQWKCRCPCTPSSCEHRHCHVCACLCTCTC